VRSHNSLYTDENNEKKVDGNNEKKADVKKVVLRT
jgi:hypothetical protein